MLKEANNRFEKFMQLGMKERSQFKITIQELSSNANDFKSEKEKLTNDLQKQKEKIEELQDVIKSLRSPNQLKTFSITNKMTEDQSPVQQSSENDTVAKFGENKLTALSEPAERKTKRARNSNESTRRSRRPATRSSKRVAADTSKVSKKISRRDGLGED